MQLQPQVAYERKEEIRMAIRETVSTNSISAGETLDPA